MELSEFFDINKKCALGFSGGVDSAYLLFKAIEFGVDIKPYFVKTAFQTEREYVEAVELAEYFGSELSVIEIDILTERNVIKNPTNRCYFCKKILFTEIIDRARKDGYGVVLEGTNMSDDVSDRPGYKAIGELGVLSPLRQCGITKETLRNELKSLKIDIWNKPSEACLATRIPVGREITVEDLERVSNAEKLLKEMGFYDFRVRVLGNAAKLQVKPAQFEKAADMHREIYSELSLYFDDVLLDFKER